MGDDATALGDRRTRGWREMGCCLLLVCFFAAWHSAGVFGGKVYFSEDTAAYFFSNRAAHHSLATHRDWSLWDPLPGLGQPRLANIQNSSFSPLSLLFYLVPTATAFSVYPTIVLSLLSIFSFGLFRARGLEPLTALFGALSWATLGSLTNHIQHPPVVETLLWLPATLFCWEMALVKRAGGWAVMGGIALAFQCFGGSPQYLLYNGLIMAIWIGQGLFTARHDKAEFVRRFGWAAGIGIVGIGLASWQLLPFLEMLQHSHRSLLHDPAQFADRYRGTPREVLLALSAEWFWWNEAPLYTHGAPYRNLPNLSLLTSVLAATAFLRRPRPWGFGLAACLFLLGMLGSAGGVAPLLAQVVPFADRLRAPIRMLVPAAFLLSWLGAFGLQRLCDSKRPAARPLAILFIAWIALIGWTLKRPLDHYVERRAYQVPPAIARLEGRIVMDFVHSQRNMPVFLVNAGLAAGVPSLLMREVLIPRNLFEGYFASQFGSLDQHDRLDRMITSAALPLPIPQAPMLRAFGLQTLVRYQAGQIRLLHLPEPLGRFSVVPGGVVAQNPQALWALIRSPSWDPLTQVILRDPVPGLPEQGARVGETEIRVLRDEKALQHLEVESSGGVMVTSGLFFPGWRVEVDGRRAEPLEVNLALRGVMLPPGKHRVEWTYRPTWLPAAWAGLALSTFVALLLIRPLHGHRFVSGNGGNPL